MDLYKCDTFNLVLTDLLLTQTDRSESGDTLVSKDTWRPAADAGC